MRVWKWLGVAGAVGISVTGAVLAVRRRRWRHYDADELRASLHDRLAVAEASPEAPADPPQGH